MGTKALTDGHPVAARGGSHAHVRLKGGEVEEAGRFGRRPSAMTQTQGERQALSSLSPFLHYRSITPTCAVAMAEAKAQPKP